MKCRFLSWTCQTTREGLNSSKIDNAVRDFCVSAKQTLESISRFPVRFHRSLTSVQLPGQWHLHLKGPTQCFGDSLISRSAALQTTLHKSIDIQLASSWHTKHLIYVAQAVLDFWWSNCSLQSTGVNSSESQNPFY